MKRHINLGLVIWVQAPSCSRVIAHEGAPTRQGHLAHPSNSRQTESKPEHMGERTRKRMSLDDELDNRTATAGKRETVDLICAIEIHKYIYVC